MARPAEPSSDGLAETAIDLRAGHRERVRERFSKVGGEAFTDAELLEAVLHLAIPRKDTKDLAKLLLKRFGSFSAALAAPRERLVEFEHLGESTITNLKIVLAAAALLTFAPLVASPLILYVKASRSHAQYDVEPRQELAAAATEFWLKSTGKPLLYVGGSGYYDMGVAFYSVERPHAFLNLDYSRSAWVTPAKLAEGGLLAVCLTADNACRSRAADFVTPESRTTEMTLQHNTVGQVRPAYAFTVTAIPPKAR